MSNIPADLKYTKSHEWISLDGNTATIGITDFAQRELGDIVYVEVESVGKSFEAGEVFGTVEIDTSQTIVSIVGNEITETEDVMKKIFETISSIPVRMVSYGGSRHNISLLISRDDKEKALQLLNKGLFDME